MDIQYVAPKTLDEAVRALLRPARLGPDPGRTARTSLVQMRSGVVTPGVRSSTSRRSREMTAIEETADGGFPDRRRRLRHAAARAFEAQQGLAGRGRGGQPDRLQAGAGPGLGRRQPAATPRRPATACRRWSPPAPSSSIRARTGAASFPVEEVPTPVRAALNLEAGRDRRRLQPAGRGRRARATPTCA